MVFKPRKIMYFHKIWPTGLSQISLALLQQSLVQRYLLHNHNRSFQACKKPSGRTHIGVKAISHLECYIILIVVTWAFVICLKCMPSVLRLRPQTLRYISGKSLMPMLQL